MWLDTSGDTPTLCSPILEGQVSSVGTDVDSISLTRVPQADSLLSSKDICFIFVTMLEDGEMSGLLGQELLRFHPDGK